MRERVIVMLKYPRPGAVKTRLIPALGEERACDLYRTLVRQTLDEVETFARIHGAIVELRLAGAPNDAAARAWLGNIHRIREQGEGDLGARLEDAVRAAFDEQANAVVVIGADCPDLRTSHLASAFAALERADLVLGPAFDGGYYLIGMRRPHVALFRDIAWSTARVLEQTLAIARSLRIHSEQLEPLHDLDVPEDLPIWARGKTAREPGLDRVSVVIPAFNEAKFLPATLAAARDEACHEIIVVDGQSTDTTAAIARAAGVVVLSAPRGRAIQMNRGAAVATGEFLLFLHADTFLPAGYSTHVRRVLAQAGTAAGAFRFGIEDHFFGRRLIELGTNWRAHRWQLPYGDQGLFLRRSQFEALGGFPEVPLLEDYLFVRQLQKRGRVVIAPATAKTSGRRWRQHGPWRTTILNQLVLLGCRAGLSPARLATWYHGESRKNRAASRHRLQASLAAR